MKFTSEDLLKAMGLKVKDKIYFKHYVYEILDNDYTDCLYRGNGVFSEFLPLTVLFNEEYTIIQPKPTLTEDEKVILRNTTCIEISREMNDDNFCGLRENLWLIKGEIKYDFNLFRHLFKSVEIGHRYEIKVLLKEN